MDGDAKAADAATTLLSLSSPTEHTTSKSIRESMNKPFVRMPSPCVLAIVTYSKTDHHENLLQYFYKKVVKMNLVRAA